MLFIVWYTVPVGCISPDPVTGFLWSIFDLLSIWSMRLVIYLRRQWPELWVPFADRFPFLEAKNLWGSSSGPTSISEDTFRASDSFGILIRFIISSREKFKFRRKKFEDEGFGINIWREGLYICHACCPCVRTWYCCTWTYFTKSRDPKIKPLTR